MCHCAYSDTLLSLVCDYGCVWILKFKFGFGFKFEFEFECDGFLKCLKSKFINI